MMYFLFFILIVFLKIGYELLCSYCIVGMLNNTIHNKLKCLKRLRNSELFKEQLRRYIILK